LCHQATWSLYVNYERSLNWECWKFKQSVYALRSFFPSDSISSSWTNLIYTYFKVENVLASEFLWQINIFSFQVLFTKSIQITELGNLLNYPSQTSISIWYYLYQSKSNNWSIQIIKFLNFKLPIRWDRPVVKATVEWK